jgi:hypothetical protein
MKYFILLSFLMVSCGFAKSNCTEEECPKQEDPIPEVSIGPIGPTGSPGISGSKGDTGQKGDSCTVASVAGGAKITCGSTSTVVTNGSDGAQGEIGSQGLGCTTETMLAGVKITCGTTTTMVWNGLNGQDATPVKMVKFCPNAPDTYPSSFPEYGICLGNKIYAVYWNNTAFLSYLTPGNYVTTSVNVNCSFKVLANTCEILN